MKNMFRKAMTVLGSAAMVGATVGSAFAASYSDTFTYANTVVVYGANAATSDSVAAGQIVTGLNADMPSGTVSLTGGESASEDEVTLGGLITAGSSNDIETTMKNSDISALKDSRFSWDDGTGSEDIDFHEELLFSGVNVLTTTSDEDYKGVAMTNDQGIAYHYVFEDAFDVDQVGEDEADTLYLTILGKQYEIEAMTNTSLTVVTSEEISLGVGESATVDGKTFTVDSIFSNKAKVNGEFINEGSTKNINGVRVEVDTVGYHSNDPDKSQVVLKVGEDISETYSDGDEYIGEDEDDPKWEWDISSLGDADGYIGVVYAPTIVSADDDDAGESVKYEGESYVLPDNYAEVKFNGLTEVEYAKVTVEFDTVDLYTATGSTVDTADAPVIKISSTEEDSLVVGGHETNEIYIFHAANTSSVGTGNTQYGSLELFYKDVDAEQDPGNRARYASRTNKTAADAVARTSALATIEFGETTIDLDMTVASGETTLHVQTSEGDIDIDVDGTDLTALAGDFTQFGETAEDADADDVQVDGDDVSTHEGEAMDNYGVIVAAGSDVESQADNDKLVLSIPDDQVYAEITVTVGGEASSTETGAMSIMDSEVSTKGADKNLIVVGGSAVNSVAAELLGGDLRGEAFTAATGVGVGEFLIQSFARGDNVALLVAGYEFDDTAKAQIYLSNNDPEVAVGKKWKGISASSAVTAVTTA